MTNFDEIWHGDAGWSSWAFRLLKFTKVWKSKMVAAAILKNRKKLPYVGRSLIITPLKVIQGHRFLYQSKAHMRLPNY